MSKEILPLEFNFEVSQMTIFFQFTTHDPNGKFWKRTIWDSSCRVGGGCRNGLGAWPWPSAPSSERRETSLSGRTASCNRAYGSGQDLDSVLVVIEAESGHDWIKERTGHALLRMLKAIARFDWLPTA